MSEKPVCYLVWKQFLRAADDVEDYYEVARPGDKCVDGSDPFPVYMRNVPEGFLLVPAKPTYPMIEAAKATTTAAFTTAHVIEIYRGMLAASTPHNPEGERG